MGLLLTKRQGPKETVFSRRYLIVVVKLVILSGGNVEGEPNRVPQGDRCKGICEILPRNLGETFCNQVGLELRHVTDFIMLDTEDPFALHGLVASRKRLDLSPLAFRDASSLCMAASHSVQYLDLWASEIVARSGASSSCRVHKIALVNTMALMAERSDFSGSIGTLISALSRMRSCWIKASESELTKSEYQDKRRAVQ